MPTVDTGWIQPETIRTRERVQVLPLFSDVAVGTDVTPISDATFNAKVDEARDLIQSSNPGEADLERISHSVVTRWQETPLIDPLFGTPHYFIGAQFWGSVFGAHDFDPLWEWLDAFVADVLDAFDAANPAVTSRFLEWQVNPFVVQPWGLHENRTVEVNVDAGTHVSRDRDGNVTGSTGLNVEHSLVLYPTTAGALYAYDSTSEWWEDDTRNDLFGDKSLLDWATTGDILASGVTGQLRYDIPDADWTAAAVSTNRTAGFNDYANLGAAFGLGPDFAITGAAPPSGEYDRASTHYGTAYFESDFTPPPYRIVYELPTARLRLYPRDGDALGWGGVARRYPAPRGRRRYPVHP